MNPNAQGLGDDDDAKAPDRIEALHPSFTKVANSVKTTLSTVKGLLFGAAPSAPSPAAIQASDVLVQEPPKKAALVTARGDHNANVARALDAVAVLRWEPPMMLAPADRQADVVNQTLADDALAEVATKDPLAAAIIYSDAVEGPNYVHNNAIVFSSEHWKKYSLVISELALGMKPADARFTGDQFDRIQTKHEGNTVPIKILEIYAWSQKTSATESARIEFLATLEGAKLLRGYKPQVQYKEEQVAFEMLKLAVALRARWRNAEPAHRSEIEAHWTNRIRELGGSDIGGVPLRVAGRDFLAGKASIGGLYLRARTQARAAIEAPARRYHVNEVSHDR